MKTNKTKQKQKTRTGQIIYNLLNGRLKNLIWRSRYIIIQSGRDKTDKNSDDELEINNVAVIFLEDRSWEKKRDQLGTVGTIWSPSYVSILIAVTMVIWFVALNLAGISCWLPIYLETYGDYFFYWYFAFFREK